MTLQCNHCVKATLSTDCMPAVIIAMDKVKEKRSPEGNHNNILLGKPAEVCHRLLDPRRGPHLARSASGPWPESHTCHFFCVRTACFLCVFLVAICVPAGANRADLSQICPALWRHRAVLLFQGHVQSGGYSPHCRLAFLHRHPFLLLVLLKASISCLMGSYSYLEGLPGLLSHVLHLLTGHSPLCRPGWS